MSNRSSGRIKSSERTFTIVEGLIELEGATITELASHLDLNASTVYNHLQTLERIGYVLENGQYEVSLKFLRIGEYARQKHEIVRVARPIVDELAETTGEIANLVTIEKDEGVFLYRADGSDAVRMDTHIGRRLPLYATAFGKAMLAFIPEDEAERIIENLNFNRKTPNTITDPGQLRAELKDIREKGFAIDDEERVKSLRCVAAPIIVDDNVLGAISVSGPTSRIKGQWFREELPEEVIGSANIIELNRSFN